jgi:hypothetical protein
VSDNGFSSDPVSGILAAAVGVRRPEHEAPRQDAEKDRRRSGGKVEDSAEEASECIEAPVHQVDNRA